VRKYACQRLDRLRINASHCHPKQAKPVLSETKEGPLYLLEDSNAGVLREVYPERSEWALQKLDAEVISIHHRWHWHPESRFFRDEGSAFVFVTENSCRSFAAAQDDSLGDRVSSSSFCPSWAAERLSMLRMTASERFSAACNTAHQQWATANCVLH
jgi:hypothetical protein